MTKVKINTHSPFQQLKKILVGQAWDEHYFDFIENKDLKFPLQQILNETNEDLEELKKILRDCDVEVFQPRPFTNETKYMSLDMSPSSTSETVAPPL